MTAVVELLPVDAEDLLVLAQPDRGGFNDFAPFRNTEEVPSAQLDHDGTLAIWSEDELVGSVSHRATYWGPNEGSKAMMIGVHLLEEARGRGIGCAAVHAHVSMLFEYTTVFRVEAHTDVSNVVTQRLLERLGFTKEGVTRQAQWRAGRRHDGILYSVLRPEWTAKEYKKHQKTSNGTKDSIV